VWWTLGFATYEHRTGEVLDVGGEIDEVLSLLYYSQA